MIRFLQTPGKFKKIALGSILVFFSAAMVIQLIPGGFLGESFGFANTTPGVLAQIDDQQVTTQEVEARAQQIREQRSYPQQLMPFIRQQAADGIVTARAMMVEANRLGLKVTDADLRQELQSGYWGQTLFPNGEFVGEARYEDFVMKNLRMSVAEFEQALKTELLLRKLRGLVADGVVVLPEELKANYLKENTKVKLEYAVVSPEDVMKQVHASEAELRAYFEHNKGRYKDAIPEQRKAKYVVVDSARVAEKMPVTRDDLQRYYNEHKEQFRVQDEVNVRHILIAAADAKDTAKVEAARKEAEDVLKQVRAGGDFAALARKYSEDPGSKDQGGSLGWIGRGRTVKEFEQAAFALNKGETSGLVQSPFGFHIIRLDDKRSAHLQSFDEVKAQIEPIVKQQKAQRDAEQIANAIQSQARTLPLEQAAAKNGFAVTEPELFTRRSQLPGVGLSPELMDRIFSATEKSAPAVAPVAQGFVVYQVTQIKPAQTPTFEQIQPRVEADFKQERAQQLLGQKTQELADRAHAEHDLKKAAQEVGATLKTSELVLPSGQVPDVGSMADQASVAFSMKPGEISGPIRGGAGNGIVFSVVERQEPSLADFDKTQEQLRESLLQRKREMVLQNFAVSLRERMEKEGKIRWNKEERDRIFNQKLGAGL
ncbi:MAG TPA: peptidyl-prolyl cis-trans isomerase [Terriglobales bacterium]|nr:peptidyl-prolyl cis-trans isomerase [Terriglobales bacterium]